MSEQPLCHAHSARTGEPCKAKAIRGGVVCPTHGGRAPQVREAALARLQAMVMPALVELRKIALQDGVESSVKLKAITDILDRTGFKPSEKVQLSGDEDGPALAIRIVKEAPAPKVEEG